jgi:hypothetical protein
VRKRARQRPFRHEALRFSSCGTPRRLSWLQLDRRERPRAFSPIPLGELPRAELHRLSFRKLLERPSQREEEEKKKRARKKKKANKEKKKKEKRRRKKQKDQRHGRAQG